MTAWVLSIVGVIFISVVFEIIVPNGKTNSFIKSIIVIIFMYVVLSPIINWIKKDENINIPQIVQMNEGVEIE